jgi:hypothetical protein
MEWWYELGHGDVIVVKEALRFRLMFRLVKSGTGYASFC